MPHLKNGYQEAVDFIFARELFGMKLGLENIGRVLGLMDNPQPGFKSVHVAGTNGKGSTSAYIDAVVRQAGYKCGLFTSPHLFDFRERVRVNGEKISKAFIVDFIDKYRSHIEENKITYFEVCTALAFKYFAMKKVDLAVVEVGLGGRLDATNTVTPLVSVITDISYDHVHILGDTLTKIAYEKAGIIKPGIPVVVGPMKPEPRREIMRIARERGASLHYIRPGTIRYREGTFRFDINNGRHDLKNLVTSLAGRHQARNAANAAAALGFLRLSGYHITGGQIKKGLAGTIWPGRFQIIKMPGGPVIILDVGHNEGGVKATAECFRQRFPGRKARLVIGFVKYKDLRNIVRILVPITKDAEIVRLNTDRTADPEEIAGLFKGRAAARISDSVVASARRVIETSHSDDIIIIGGSHYAVGEFLENQAGILGFGEKPVKKKGL